MVDIRKTLTKATYEKFHRRFVRMWKWLSQNPSYDKADYIERVENIETYYNCYCCELVEQVCRGRVMFTCKLCPLINGGPEECSEYYELWDIENTLCKDNLSFNLKSDYADEISREPWYEYEEYCDKVNKYLNEYMR